MNDPLTDRLKQIQQRFEAQRPILVKKMAAVGIVFIKENFQKQGFQGATFEPWLKRANKKDTTPILFKSGTLFRSPFTSYSDAEKAIITSSLPYSRIHNEGGLIQHTAHSAILNFYEKGGKLKLGKVGTINQQRKISTIRRATIGAHESHMPKRQFMGPSPVLSARITEMLRKELPKVFTITSS